MSHLESEIRRIIKEEIKSYFSNMDLSESESAVIAFAEKRGGNFTINELNKGVRKIKSADHARFVAKVLVDKGMAESKGNGAYSITIKEQTLEDLFE